MGRILHWSTAISSKSASSGKHFDPRFTLHQRQPRANKLDVRQHRLCIADPAYSEALAVRVKDARRFAAFIEGLPSYVRLGPPCPRCNGFRRRTRDRSCYTCHLDRGRKNFERMKAGISPNKKRSLDSHLDLLARRRAVNRDEYIAAAFGRLAVKRWPTGRLEVTFPDGYIEPDLNKQDALHVHHLMAELPELREALIWAGWF